MRGMMYEKGRQLRDITAALQMVEGKRCAAILHEELHLGSVLGARKSKCRRIAEGLLHGLFRWLPVLSRYFWGKNNEGSWGVSACERCFGSSINTPAIKPVGPAGWLSLGADRTA
jgi:hypothetical protein